MTRTILGKIILFLAAAAILGSGAFLLRQQLSGTDPEKTAPAEVTTGSEQAGSAPAEESMETPEAPETGPPREAFRPFKTARVTPDMFLDGAGTNIDSPEFFESDDPQETLLLVSGKGNDVIEVWKFPFRNNQLSPLRRDSLPNGLDVDQDKDWLLIGDADKKIVEIRPLPGLSPFSVIGQGAIDSGETNLDVLTFPDGQKRVYVSESHAITALELETGKKILSFSPEVESIEEVLADSFHQAIYVPEESGVESEIYRGGAVAAYHPDGKAYLKNGSNVFGRGLFTGDEEGITLYACRGDAGKDDGRGFIIVANQASRSLNRFEFFDRTTWTHLGSLVVEGVSGTDGIAVTERPLPNYPQGLFAVSNSDQNVALVPWEKVTEATGLQCSR